MNINELFDKAIVEPNSGCWLWEGATHRHGYGSVRHSGKSKLAHRVAYTLTYGDIPEGMDVCHKCDVRACVNPDHLFLGTHTDNMRDRAAKGKNNFSKLRQDEIRAILEDDRPAAVIAVEYGVTFGAICWQKRKANGSKFKRAAHLTPDIVSKIVADPRPYSQIANDYGVSVACICKRKKLSRCA